MIFTSQSGLTDPTREAAWDDWYLGHLDAMVGVPGIGSAQRFQALPSPGPAIPPPSSWMPADSRTHRCRPLPRR